MKVLFFDTESSDLFAPWGRILCASFAGLTENPVSLRGDKPARKSRVPSLGKCMPGRDVIDDARLCIAIRDLLEEADIIVSWNGKLHDIPLLNARLQFAGERPVAIKRWPAGTHLDAMYYVRGSAMKIGGWKLDRAATFFGVAHQKTSIDGVTWQRAAAGYRKDMDLVVEHCEADVNVLRDLLPYYAPHVNQLALPFSAWWKFADKVVLNNARKELSA